MGERAARPGDRERSDARRLGSLRERLTRSERGTVRVAVAGGHGKIGLRLLRLLAERGDEGLGIVRNPDHTGDLEAIGSQPVVVDLEREDSGTLARAIDGCDAAVFAAGAGPGSGAERKRTMDL